MILFIKLIVIIGLIAFPIIKYLEGHVNLLWVKGIILGINWGSEYFLLKSKEEQKVVKLTVIQFQIGFFAVQMSYSKELPNAKVEDYE